jgi:hypothetical protein
MRPIDYAPIAACKIVHRPRQGHCWMFITTTGKCIVQPLSRFSVAELRENLLDSQPVQRGARSGRAHAPMGLGRQGGAP